MMDSNPFSVLSSQQPNAPSLELKEGQVDEEPPLRLQHLGSRLQLVQASLDVASLPATANLLAVANAAGWLAAATGSGFVLAQLASIRAAFSAARHHADTPFTPQHTIQTPSRVIHLHFANNDQFLVISLESGGIALYRLTDLLDGKTEPDYVFNVPVPVQLLPNPAERPELLAILAADGRLSVVNLDTRAEVATFGERLTAACWSVKGKQLLCGGAECQLYQYTPERELKMTVPAPPSQVNSASDHVADIRWLENHVFIVSYAPPTPDGSTSPILAIARSGTSFTFTALDDQAFPSPDYETRENRRLVVGFKDWPPLKHLTFVASASSSQIAIFGARSETNEWATLDVDEASRPTLPSTADMADTCPLGLVVDLTSTEGVPDRKAAASGSEGAMLPPAPLLLAYSSQGILVAWRVLNDSGKAFAGMLGAAAGASNEADAMEMSTPSLTPAASTQGTSFSAPAPSVQPPGFSSTRVPTSTGTGFGAPSFGSSAFGAAAFGKSSFGASSTTPAGSPAKPSSGFGESGFAGFAGGASTSAPAFAQSSTVASTPSAFGEVAKPSGSAFGASAGTSAAPAFGASSSLGFGQFKTTPASAPSVSGSAFGGFASKPTTGFGFGLPSATPPKPAVASTPAFQARPRGLDDDEDGMEDDKPARRDILAEADDLEPTAKGKASSAFGFGGFGIGSTPTSNRDAVPKAFAPTAFTPAPPPPSSQPVTTAAAFSFAAPATPSTPSAFGQQVSSTSAFGQSSFGKSSFGTSSFGQTSFAAPKTTSSPSPAPISTGSAFASFAPSGKTSAFGGSSDAAKPSGFSAFASTSSGSSSGKPAFAFAETPAEASKPSQSVFGQPVASTKPPTSVVTTPAPVSQTAPAFGWGSKPAETKEPDQSASAAPPSPPVSLGTSAAAPVSTSSPSSVQPPRPEEPLRSSNTSQPSVKEERPSTPPPRIATSEPVKLKDESRSPTIEAKGEEVATIEGEAEVKPSAGEDMKAAKSLMGFTSSPPISRKPSGSLLSRLGPPVEQKEEDEESDPELSDEGEEVEADEEGEGEEEEEVEGDDEAFSDEEELEELGSEEEEEEEHGTPTPGQAVVSQPVPASTAGPSLLDRMKAAAPTTSAEATKIKSEPTSPFSFGGFKLPSSTEAPKTTSSPLSTPPPAQPKASPFSFAQPAAEKPAASKPASSSPFAKPVSPALEQRSAALFAPPPPSKDQPAPAPSPPSQAKSPFSAAQANKAFGFAGFGAASAPKLSSPLAAPAASAPSTSFSSFGARLGGPPSPQPPPLPLSQPKPTPLPSFSAAKPAPPPQQPPAQAFSMNSKDVPKVQMPAGKPAQVKKTGDALQDQHLELVAMMNSDLAALKESLATCKTHSKAVAKAQLADTPSLETLDPTRSKWSLGDLSAFSTLAKEAEKRVSESKASASGLKKGVADLQSQLLKAQAKREECLRYLKAKSDPEVAKKIRVRQLGPEQAENQRRLRRSSQAVKDALSAVEIQLVRLKDRITEEELGRPGFRPPSLDSINRAVRNISSAVNARTLELDDLGRQLSSVSMRDSPKPARSRSIHSPSPANSTLLHSVSGSSDADSAASPARDAAFAAGRKAVEAQQANAALRDTLLRVRPTPPLTRAGPAPPPPIIQSAPSQATPKKSAATATTSSPATSTPPFLRAPMKIEFGFPSTSASNVAPPPHSSPASSPAGGHIADRTKRQHFKAVKVAPKPAGVASPEGSAAVKPTFDWGPLPSVVASQPRRASQTFEGLEAPKPVATTQKERVELAKTERLYGDEDEASGDEGTADSTTALSEAEELEYLETISEREEE